MIMHVLRRYLILSSLFLVATSAAVAGGFTFSTSQYLNFDTLGGTSYNITMDASVTVGNDYYASSQLSVGNFSLSDSSTGYGESGCYIQISNIRKVNGQWVAGSVYTYEQNLNGSPITHFYYDVPMPTLSYVTGYTYCNGYSNPFWCSISW
jgi:hypothetical protein